MLQGTIYFLTSKPLGWTLHSHSRTDLCAQCFLLYDLCGNFLYMPTRIDLAFFKCTASFWYVCQQQQWRGQKPSIQVCSITPPSWGLSWSFKEKSRCACWLNLKQKISHKVLYSEIHCIPGVLNFGRFYTDTMNVLMFSTVIPVPRLELLQIGSSWLRLEEFQDTMCLATPQ